MNMEKLRQLVTTWREHFKARPNSTDVLIWRDDMQELLNAAEMMTKLEVSTGVVQMLQISRLQARWLDILQKQVDRSTFSISREDVGTLVLGIGSLMTSLEAAKAGMRTYVVGDVAKWERWADKMLALLPEYAKNGSSKCEILEGIFEKTARWLRAQERTPFYDKPTTNEHPQDGVPAHIDARTLDRLCDAVGIPRTGATVDNVLAQIELSARAHTSLCEQRDFHRSFARNVRDALGVAHDANDGLVIDTIASNWAAVRQSHENRRKMAEALDMNRGSCADDLVKGAREQRQELIRARAEVDRLHKEVTKADERHQRAIARIQAIDDGLRAVDPEHVGCYEDPTTCVVKIVGTKVREIQSLRDELQKLRQVAQQGGAAERKVLDKIARRAGHILNLAAKESAMFRQLVVLSAGVAELGTMADGGKPSNGS